MLNIKGSKKHKEVNIYQRGSASGRPIKVEIQNPEDSLKYLCESSGERENLTCANQIILRDPSGMMHNVTIDDDIKKSSELAKVLKRKGMSDYELISVYIDPERKHIVEHLQNLKDKRLEWKDVELGHKGEKQFLITCEFTEKYFQGIAKIAFHYFLQHFNRHNGYEKEFDGIKNFILNGGNTNEWVTRCKGSFIEDFTGELLIVPDSYWHFFVAEDTGESIFVKLMFFAGPKGICDMHHEVRISNERSLIYRPRKAIGHQIFYFKEPDKDGFIGEMKELRRHDKKFLLSLRGLKFEEVGPVLRRIKGVKR